MIDVTHRQQIDQPVERVFAFAADPENNPRWWTRVQAAEIITDRPLRQGSRFREVSQGPIGAVESVYEVARFEPDNQVRFVVVEGPLEAQVSETFTAVNGGTELRVQVIVRPHGLWRLLGPVMGRMVDQNWRGNLRRLKSLLEESDA